MSENSPFLSTAYPTTYGLGLAATNLLNPATATGGVNAGASSQYIIVRHISIVNGYEWINSFSLWKGASGATAAGTEIIGTGQAVWPFSRYDWYGELRLDAADFLVGSANADGVLTISFEGEVGVAG